MPGKFWSHQTDDFSCCDLLLVLGTSLVVSPFNTLVGKVVTDKYLHPLTLLLQPKSSVSRCYINKTKPGASSSLLGWALNMTVK